jgi:hypothetical protein
MKTWTHKALNSFLKIQLIAKKSTNKLTSARRRQEETERDPPHQEIIPLTNKPRRAQALNKLHNLQLNFKLLLQEKANFH